MAKKTKKPRKRIVTLMVEVPAGVKIEHVMGYDEQKIRQLLKIIEVHSRSQAMLDGQLTQDVK